MSLGLSRVERLSTVGTEVVGEKLLCESWLRVHNNNSNGTSTQKTWRWLRIDFSALQGTAECGGLKYALFLRQKWSQQGRQMKRQTASQNRAEKQSKNKEPQTEKNPKVRTESKKGNDKMANKYSWSIIGIGRASVLSGEKTCWGSTRFVSTTRFTWIKLINQKRSLRSDLILRLALLLSLQY